MPQENVIPKNVNPDDSLKSQIPAKVIKLQILQRRPSCLIARLHSDSSYVYKD